jgi:type I restriction enzyme S subunit
MDASSGRARTEIALLREYRTRLIADVVTGKLDVREAAARLSDEVDDAGPLDDAEADADAEALDADGEAVEEEAEA